MNKAQLVEAIALDANISKIDARKAVDAIIRVTVQSLREGERLTLTGLGTFSVQQKAARVGRNPRTGAAVKIPPRKAVKFRPTIELKYAKAGASEKEIRALADDAREQLIRYSKDECVAEAREKGGLKLATIVWRSWELVLMEEV